MPKNKKIAVLLAIFFGALSWIYTYKYDKKKLWITILILSISILFPAIIGTYSDDTIFSLMIIGISLNMIALTLFISHTWAIIQSILRDKSFYDNYGA